MTTPPTSLGHTAPTAMPMSSDSNEKANSEEWFYQLLGLATGPVSVERLKWLIDQNHLTKVSLVGRSEDGPWQQLDESPLAHLVTGSAATKTPAKKKPVRISSGSRGSSKKLPRVKDNSPPTDEAAFVEDGIEIEEELEVVEEPAVHKPGRPKPAQTTQQKSQQGRTKPKPAKAPVLEDLEVVRPTSDRDSPKARAAKKREQQIWYLKVAGAMLGVVLVVFLGRMLFGPGRDPAGDAYKVFREIGDGLERNSAAMNDIHWNTHVKESRAKVEAALEPLREAASADEPGTQSLVWAGEQLLKMLQGTRLIPDEMTAKFENYMADFEDAPISDALSPPPNNNSDEEASEIKDPAF